MSDASRYVTDEAVQAACDEADWTWSEEPHIPRPQYVMRPILTAAAPHIRAQVLREAAETFRADNAESFLGAQVADLLNYMADTPTAQPTEHINTVSLYDPPQSETEAAVERVRALHTPTEDNTCWQCLNQDDDLAGQPWPCPTIAALEGGDA